MANICKWRRVPLSLWPCHGVSDTSHRTQECVGEKKKEGSWKTGRYEQLPARRTGVTWLLCYPGFFVVLSALSWFPCFCNLFHWPICLAESFLFCVSLLCSGGRDRFTWAGFFEVKMPTAPRCSQSSSNQGLIPVIKIWEITLIHHSPSTPIG